LSRDGLFVGNVDGDAPSRLEIDPSDLTTHGVAVGMTGSGKTGLLITLVEEALLRGIPAVVLDPKGDLANLFLTFPSQEPREFAPWVDPQEAQRAGVSVDDLAAQTAARWREGLGREGLGSDQIRELRERSVMRLYTPGSDAGLPVNVLSGFEPPDLSWDTDAEILRERIAAAVSALLSRAGEDADPLQSPSHIFLANLLENRWRAGERPGLEAILGYLLHPPFAKLGVLHVDTFYPPDRRRETMQKLNALLASPAFAAWQVGVPLRFERFMEAPAGKTPLGLFYTAHLGDEDRQMFATLLLGEVISWMRRQSGTGSLRLLVVIDEVWGLMPPHPANPPTKQPMLTLLKQARAFGVGLVVATQNPVDLDYKGLTNAGVWCVGRLSTERDKARLLDGLEMVDATASRAEMDNVISALKPRQFLMRNVHDKGGPKVFSTRWAMSYLRGPLTRDEVRKLVPDEARTWAGAAAATPPGAAATPAVAATTGPAATPIATRTPGAAVMPAPPPGVTVRFLEPRALQPDRPQGSVAGARPGPPRRYRPAILGRASVRFDETRAALDHAQVEWRLIFPLDGAKGWRWPDVDAPDLSGDLASEPVPGVPFEPLLPALEERKTFTAQERDLKETLLGVERLELYVCAALKTYSRVGESKDAFAERVRALADDLADQELAALRGKVLEKKRRIEDRIQAEALDVERARATVSARKQETFLSVGESVLGMFLGGRKPTRVLSQAASKQRMAGTAASQLQKEEAQLASAQSEMEELEASLARDVERIRADKAALAETIATFPVALERDDVRVEEVALLWIPDAE
jgi:hypothetical protein